MTEIGVDLTGITDGQTLVWSTAQGLLVPGDRMIAGPGAVKVAATRAALGAGAFDGQEALITLGAWPNLHVIRLFWNLAAGVWIGAEKTVLTQNDTTAMDLGNRSGAQLLDWSELAYSIPYAKSYAQLTAAPDLSSAAFTGGTGVLTVDSTLSPHTDPFAPSGTLRIRDNVITYTGKTGTTFTGCTRTSGSGGVIPVSVDVVQGAPGGWGMVPETVGFAAEGYAAGFRLQESLIALTNAAPGGKRISVAPYWRQAAVGDGVSPVPVPPAGGLGLGAIMVSGVADGGAKTDERSFFETENGWTDLPFAPTKRYLTPTVVAKMEAGAIDTGEVLDAMLRVRWVG